MTIRKEPYWSLEDGNRPMLSEFNPRERGVVVFRLELPVKDTAHLNGQYTLDGDMQVMDPQREREAEEWRGERIEAIRLELKRGFRI